MIMINQLVQFTFNTVVGIPFTADLEYDCWGVQTRSTPTNMECSTTEEERQQFEVNWISDNDGPLNYTLRCLHA